MKLPVDKTLTMHYLNSTSSNIKSIGLSGSNFTSRSYCVIASVWRRLSPKTPTCVLGQNSAGIRPGLTLISTFTVKALHLTHTRFNKNIPLSPGLPLALTAGVTYDKSLRAYLLISRVNYSTLYLNVLYDLLKLSTFPLMQAVVSVTSLYRKPQFKNTAPLSNLLLNL